MLLPSGRGLGGGLSNDCTVVVVLSTRPSATGSQDMFDDASQIVAYLWPINPDRSDSELLENHVPMGVVGFPTAVTIVVDFHAESSRMTIEVQNVMVDRMLPAEPESDRFSTKLLPKFELRVAHRVSEFSSSFSELIRRVSDVHFSFFYPLPNPPPLPAQSSGRGRESGARWGHLALPRRVRRTRPTF